MRPGSLLETKSDYQAIRIAAHPNAPGEVILYCDNMWQFDTSVEHKYHEALATMPACTSESLERVLVCGGGDGLVVRNLLRFRQTGFIQLVEIDPKIIEIFKTPPFERINRRSLHEDRVEVIVSDAIKFAETAKPESYDFIVLDFPSPGKYNKEKNYPNLFAPDVLRKFLRLLKFSGVLSAQVGVSSETLEGWFRTAIDSGFNAWHYDVAYNPKAIDSIGVLSRQELRPVRPLPDASAWASPRRLELAFSEVTRIRSDELDYFRLFEFGSEIELAPGEDYAD